MHRPLRSCRLLKSSLFLPYAPFSIRTIYKPLLWLIFLLEFTCAASAQTPAIIWQKTLGGTGSDEAQAITATSDGGYVVAGTGDSNDGDETGNHGNGDFWVVKVNGSGSLVWQKSLGGTGNDEARAIIATQDGGYVVAGYTNSINGDVTTYRGGYDFWVVKLDGSGNLVWQKSFGGTQNDFAYAITASADGGYVVAGNTQSTDGDLAANQSRKEGWILKLDGAGNLVWQKFFDGVPSAITTSADGGYAVTGTTSSTNVPGYQSNNGGISYWVAKLDGAGNLIWQKAFNLYRIQFALAITTSLDGGYVVVGWNRSDNGIVDYWVVKVNGSGDLVWQKSLGGSRDDFAQSIVATADGGYIVAGQTLSTDGDVTGNHGNTDIWVVKLDGNGNKVSQKTLGGTNNESAPGLIPTPDGNFLVAGFTESNNGDVSGNHGARDYWLVKLGITPSITSLTANPNPVCAGKPVLLAASIGYFTGNYSYTITNGTGINVQGSSTTQAFSQTLIASGSGSQSLTLTVANTVGSTSSILSVTVNSDGNCSIPTPCASVQSGNWADPATWLCGHEPTVSDLVIISPSHVVTISTDSAQAQRIRNNGTIRYASTGTKVFIKGD